MFNNKKNDPLIDSVKAVMEQNELFRQIEQELLEEYGVVSRKALPHEIQPEFDAVLAEAKKCAMEELKGDQNKIDANKNKKIDAHDFKLLRAKKKMGLEEETPADEGRRAAGYKGKTPGEQGEIAAKNDDEMRAKLKKGAVVHHEGVPHVVRKVEGDDITIQKMHGKAAYPKVVSMSKITKVTGETVPVEESEQLDETSPRKAKKYIQRAADDLADKTDPQYGYITDKDEDEISRAVENRRKGIHRALKKMEESEQLDEKAVSEVQQKLMAMALRYKRDPESMQNASSEVKRLAQAMPEKQLRDFAKTSHKGIPERVDEEKLTGGAKAAWQMGEKHGAKGSAKFSDKQLANSFGEYAKHYHRGYESASDNREWREKQQDDRRLREDIDSIMEEIRNNLEEQLDAVYESGDEDAFTDFVDSLTEEQAEILGLNEKFFGYGNKNAGTGADPTATNKIAIQSTAEKEKSDIKQKSVMGQSAQSTPAPKATAPNFGGGTNSGKVGAPAKPGAPMAAGQKVAIARAQDAKDMEKARTSLKGDKFGAREAQIKSRTPDQAFAAAKKAGNVPASVPARTAPVAVPARTPAPESSKPAVRSIQRPITRPTINRPTNIQKRVGYSTTRAGASAGETMMANLMREESEKPQIKESFEHFIRNKFLKD